MTIKKENNGGPKQCSSCFFSERFPNVTVGANGKCNFCNNNNFYQDKKKIVSAGLKDLVRVAESIKKNRTGKYDCIIGASGGLDSSYVVYVAKKMLDLNPLVISYQHGFNYDLGVDNLKRMCEKLGVDLRIVTSKGRYDAKYLYYMLRGLKQIDVYWGMCAFCHYVLPAALYKSAHDENIHTTMGSANLYESRLYLEKWFKIKFILKQAARVSPLKLATMIAFAAIAHYYLIRLKLEFYVPPFVNIFSRRPKEPAGLRCVNVSEYIEWDVQKMTKVMREEAGWEQPESPAIPMRFDCKIEHAFVNHTYKKATGFTQHAIICNNLIYDKVYVKEQLAKAIEHYDDLIEITRSELNEFKISE